MRHGVEHAGFKQLAVWQPCGLHHCTGGSLLGSISQFALIQQQTYVGISYLLASLLQWLWHGGRPDQLLLVAVVTTECVSDLVQLACEHKIQRCKQLVGQHTH
jgi:hypothetical protein